MFVVSVRSACERVFVSKDELARLLRAGHSLDQIGRIVGLSGSTVSYWVRAHGLDAVNAAKHAPRGGLERRALERLVAAGFSQRQIAEEMSVSNSTVRHWIKKYGLETYRSKRRRERVRVPADSPSRIELTCIRHGVTAFRRKTGGNYACARCASARCASEAVIRRRRRVKQALVSEAGGRCRLCGYDRYVGALEFHHFDPSTKSFSLSHAGVTRSLARAQEEARKCILLCANCHAEVEGGIVQVDRARESDSTDVPHTGSPG